MKNKNSGRLDSWQRQEMFPFSKKTSKQLWDPLSLLLSG